MTASPARSPRVVRIVSRQDDDVEQADAGGLLQGLRNALPAALILWFLFWVVVFIGLNVPLLFWGVR